MTRRLVACLFLSTFTGGSVAVVALVAGLWWPLALPLFSLVSSLVLLGSAVVASRPKPAPEDASADGAGAIKDGALA